MFILSEVANVLLKLISLHHREVHWVQLVMLSSESELSHSHAFPFRKKEKDNQPYILFANVGLFDHVTEP